MISEETRKALVQEALSSFNLYFNTKMKGAFQKGIDRLVALGFFELRGMKASWDNASKMVEFMYETGMIRN